MKRHKLMTLKELVKMDWPPVDVDNKEGRVELFRYRTKYFQSATNTSQIITSALQIITPETAGGIAWLIKKDLLEAIEPQFYLIFPSHSVGRTHSDREQLLINECVEKNKFEWIMIDGEVLAPALYNHLRSEIGDFVELEEGSVQ